VPAFRVPDDGAADPQEVIWSLSGAESWHEANTTPDNASVSGMVHVTFCAVVETSTVAVDSERAPSAGATRSGFDVTVNIDGNARVEGSMGVSGTFPTASDAATLAVQTPGGEYRGKAMTHDHVPFCGVPDVGAARVQLFRWS
jgi:hypothetical protein